MRMEPLHSKNTFCLDIHNFDTLKDAVESIGPTSTKVLMVYFSSCFIGLTWNIPLPTKHLRNTIMLNYLIEN